MESISNIFKVYRMIDSKTIDTIFVFYGKKVDPNEQAKLINKIFTKDEVALLNDEKEPKKHNKSNKLHKQKPCPRRS